MAAASRGDLTSRLCRQRSDGLPRWPATGSTGQSMAIVPFFLPHFPHILLHLAPASFSVPLSFCICTVFVPSSAYRLHRFPCCLRIACLVFHATFASFSEPLSHCLHHFARLRLFSFAYHLHCTIFRTRFCFIVCMLHALHGFLRCFVLSPVFALRQ